MQRKKKNVETKEIKKKLKEVLSKNKRSISEKEKNELMDYYMTKKVSEYSQRDLININDTELFIDQNNQNNIPSQIDPHKQTGILDQKCQTKVALKKELNLLVGLGEDQDKFMQMTSHNIYKNQSSSQRYSLAQIKHRINSDRNQNELSPKKQQIQSKIMNQTVKNAQSFVNNLELLPHSFKPQISKPQSTSNMYHSSNNINKNYHLSLNLSKDSLNKIQQTPNQSQGQHEIIQKLTNNKEDYSQCKQYNSASSSFNSESFDYFSKQNKSKANYSKTHRQSLQNGVHEFQENDKSLQQNGNELQFNSGPFPQRRMSSSHAFSLKRIIRPSSIQNTSNPQLTKSGNYNQKCSQYIKFQNQFLNNHLPQPTQQDITNMEVQAQKLGVLKYFNFPKHFNLSDNKISKLDQNKQIFQAYLSSKSPKQVSEEMKDPSLLSLLQKVKNNIKFTSHKHFLLKQQFSSQNNSPTQISSFPTQINQEIQIQNDNPLQNNSNIQELNLNNQSQDDKENNYGSEKFQTSNDNKNKNNLDQIKNKDDLKIENNISANNKINRCSSSCDKGSLVKQLLREKFNHDFNINMINIRARNKSQVQNDELDSSANNICMSSSKAATNLNNLQTNNNQIRSGDKKNQPFLQNLLKQNTSGNKTERQSSSNIKDRILAQSFYNKQNIDDSKLNKIPQIQNKQQDIQFLQYLDNSQSDLLFSQTQRQSNENQISSINFNNTSDNNINNNIRIQLLAQMNINRKQQMPYIKENLNNSFDTYQPSNNHLKNSKQHYKNRKDK